MAAVIQAHRLPDTRAPHVVYDPEILEGYLEDASGSPPGSASGLVRVDSEAQAATFLRETNGRNLKILIQAARSSLTGGAVPDGEVVVSVERMNERGPLEPTPGGGEVTVQPGMRLRDLQRSLAAEGYYFPPVPTYQEAMLGGAVSTNAGGAASFKYGVTRQWVQALRVLLFNGDLLILRRGQHVARRGTAFHIGLSDGRKLDVPAPDYQLPELKKVSAGYYSADSLDLVDLFVGAEGTLGLITAITVRLQKLPAAVLTGLVTLSDPRTALPLAAAMRDAALEARERPGARGPDIRSIEWLDDNSLALLREHGDDRRLRVELPASARAALIFETELPQPSDTEQVTRSLADYLERRAPAEETPLVRLF